MAVIKIPRPPAAAMDKNRPVSSLLRMQIEHMQHAEFRLPANKQTNIYINTIKTEGEAAEYIRLVTERLHAAHDEARRPQPKRKVPRGRGLEIAASAATPARTLAKKKSKPKASKKKTGKGKPKSRS